MEHVFSCAWDAPFEKVSVRYRYIPGYAANGPLFACAGEPSEPDDIEVLSAVVTVNGKRHEAPDWLAEAFGKLLDDELMTEAREYIAAARAYRGREAA